MEAHPTAAAAPPVAAQDGPKPPEPSPLQACTAPQSSAPQSTGVSNCYVFKSRLQEYAQKANIPTPEYHTLKEGPSHDPIFKSTVIVNNVTYDSLPGFFNRKAAEQSAAEVALMEIHKSGHKTECIPTVHETGLCKNMLQEYAQKMNYAIPLYVCSKQPSGLNPFICTVEIGGIRYIGAAAKTKKEAEIKAARTALLAIQRSSETVTNGTSQYSVLPGKKKVRETQVEVITELKPKKESFKKKWPRKWFPRNKDKRTVQSNKDELGSGKDEAASGIPSTDIEMNMGQRQIDRQIWNESEHDSGKMIDDLIVAVETNGYSEDLQQVGSDFSYSDQYSIGVDGSTTLQLETL